MLREPFVSSGRALHSDESGYARHGTYHRVVAVGALQHDSGPWSAAETRIVAGGQSRSEAATPALARIEPRYALIDAGRLIAALGVISAHVGYSPLISSLSNYSHLRLPFFMLLAMFFLFRRAQRNAIGGFKDYAWAKIKQLYLPFLAWAVIYLVFKNIKSLLIVKGGIVLPHLEMFLNGNTAHLWFIPYLLAACLIAYPAACWLIKGHRATNIGILGVIGLVIALCPAPEFPETSAVPFTIRWTLVHGWSIFPCIAWGLAAALIYPSIREKLGSSTFMVGVALIAVGTTIVAIFGRVPLFEAVAAVGFLVICLTPINNNLLNAVAKYGRYTYGIYLIHMIFVNTMRTIAARWMGLNSSNGLNAFILLAGFAMSLAAVILLARSPRTRWLIAFEPATKPRTATPATVHQPELAIAA